MSTYIKVVSIIGLAAVLLPAVSYARHDRDPRGPVVHRVAIPDAKVSSLHGRPAERAPLQPTYTIAGPATEVAGLEVDPSDNSQGK